MNGAITRFLKLSNKEKTKKILPILILNNLILFNPGNVPPFYVALIFINSIILTPIIVPFVLILPIIYKNKASFLFYLYFLTNSINLFFLGMVVYNGVFNTGNLLMIIPFLVGIVISHAILKEYSDESIL